MMDQEDVPKQNGPRGQAGGAEAAPEAPDWQQTGNCVGFNRWKG